ncbi:dihydroorotate dehydrogenase electron transfer subunit, partial [Candidatus Woesearchaeota archaeon]|nr:dihydroorotate dehydrogenase electron transfer subunit [Candidatus Woesearchaeota archaeon]
MKDKEEKTELPVVLPVDKIVDEGPDTRTFVFRHRLEVEPGQFVMLWLPRIDEKPFSVSYQDKDKFAVTVMAVGPFSKRMMKLKPGDKVGIRGPYG